VETNHAGRSGPRCLSRDAGGLAQVGTWLILIFPSSCHSERSEESTSCRRQMKSRFLVATLLGMTNRMGVRHSSRLYQTRSSIFRLPVPPFHEVLNCFSTNPAS
jgi:hypothetical protein